MFQKLSTRIIGILVAFFLVALIAIGLTLYLSWQLEGNAAAINDAGSQRMRTYRIVFLLSRSPITAQEEEALKASVTKEVVTFEHVMRDLEQGNPARPLFLPREAGIQQLVRQMRSEWDQEMRPRIESMLQLSQDQRAVHLLHYRASVEQFVSHVNQLVAAVEVSGTRSATWLRLLQIGLIVLAMIGTALLITFFFVMVIRPLEEMRDGIRRMSEADFRVRLKVRRKDEFGELGQGFNAMADRLEDIYGQLEQRVEEKTRDIEIKHRELTLLYEVAAYLSVPVARDVACHEVLDKVMALLDAQAGLVRFVEDGGQNMRIGVHRNLSEDFLRCEGCIPIADCLCGGAASSGQPVSSILALQPEPDRGVALACRDREGFAAMVAIPISAKNQTLGVFNLFFRTSRTLTENEVRLLETVGQHLGVAIENQRLVEREKEMAVSEERNLLAQELHDSIAQSLAFLNIQTQMLQDSLRRADMQEAFDELASIREGIQESYDDVRELLVHFRTRVVAGNVETAIASALEKFEGQTGIATVLERSGNEREIATQNAIQILHIVQEALSNIRKHAQASQVRVSIERGDNPVIRVEDNGRGFDTSQRRDDGDLHVGLKIMRERAHRIGGQFTIESTLGKGTRVSLYLPRENL
ncbi:MAG: type IV pili methyl-accepting chemotaxis transducer N-terminal domain-containing protein [Sterolibacterium sp.]|nr:type IV pili methyl-accepting chemotaxis transducer N-terminal domain-containing protein [Sterolibacterium sp.]